MVAVVAEVVMNNIVMIKVKVTDEAVTHLLTLDLMLEAVPYSSANILETREIWDRGVRAGLWEVRGWMIYQCLMVVFMDVLWMFMDV